VFVVAGRPVAAMARHGTGWITNIRQGARPAAAPVSGPLADLAVAAADAVGALYAGVDLIEAADDGGLAVLEVNSMPAWQGLQGVSEGVDIAGELAAAVLARADA
jgi:glutathione synthase/RimK-type ligase-like ATP-grasp enzyme